jgi:type VI secretion system protein
MKGASLLARIRNPELAIPRRQVLESELRESVLQHLQGMCSTRIGSMLTQPDYGIPDVSDMVHSFPHAISMMQRALKHTIETYEPRLTNVRINHVASDTGDLMVRFDVTAQLVGDSGRSPVKFETTFDVSRKLTVR